MKAASFHNTSVAKMAFELVVNIKQQEVIRTSYEKSNLKAEV